MNKDQKKVRRVLNKYKKKLNIEDYFIDVMICDDYHVKSGFNSVAKIVKDNSYAEVMSSDMNLKEYSIVINRFALDNELDDTILHELLHILLWEFTDIFDVLLPLSGLSISRQAEVVNTMACREHSIIERLIKVIK